MIFKYATELKIKEALEIGCGDGRISSFLKSRTQTLIAIDPDSKSIYKAKTKFAGLDFRIGSGECLDFPDNRFDLILFTLSLHHQDSRIALEEASRVLKDKGKILVLEPVNDGEIEQVCNIFNDEAQALSDAYRAICRSDLIIEGSETFFTEWIFESEAKLFRWLFDFYKTPYDSFRIKQVRELLQYKLKRRPLRLKDKISIMSLRKPSGRC